MELPGSFQPIGFVSTGRIGNLNQQVWIQIGCVLLNRWPYLGGEGGLPSGGGGGVLPSWGICLRGGVFLLRGVLLCWVGSTCPMAFWEGRTLYEQTDTYIVITSFYRERVGKLLLSLTNFYDRHFWIWIFFMIYTFQGLIQDFSDGRNHLPKEMHEIKEF